MSLIIRCKALLVIMLFSVLLPVISLANLFIVTNTLNTGAGSFRQAIINVNASTAVRDTIHFNIPLADPNYNAGTGVFSITLTTFLPELKQSQVLIDGYSQTIFTGNTNPVTFRTLTTAGTGIDGIEGTADDPVFPAIQGAEVQIRITPVNRKFTIVGDSNIVRGLAFRNVRVVFKGNSEGLIEHCTWGIDAHSFTDPGIGNRITSATTTDEGCLELYDTTINLIIRNNLFAYANQRGILVIDANWNYNMLITENEMAFTNRKDDFVGGGIEFAPIRRTSGLDSTTDVYFIRKGIISNNVIHDAKCGASLKSESCIEFDIKDATYDVVQTSGRIDSMLLENNTIYEGDDGFFIHNMNLPSVGNIFRYNIVRNNTRRGININTTSKTIHPLQFTISKNAIYNNARLGIDLRPGDITIPAASAGAVNTNDDNDVDTGANTSLNFPLITLSAYIGLGDLQLDGVSPAGAIIEIFLADNNASFSPLYPTSPDPLPIGYTSPLGINGFGEGRQFLYSFVEGSVDDLDLADTTYNDDGTGVIGNRTEKKWRVIIPAALLPPGFDLLWRLSSTATDINGNTSEFGPSPVLEMLPIEKQEFVAFKKNDHVKIRWKTFQPDNFSSAEIQWSTDARNWKIIALLPLSGNQQEYIYYHHQPVAGANYYRVKTTGFTARIKYSNSILIRFGAKDNEVLSIFPNPAQSWFSLVMPEKEENKKFVMTIHDTKGRLLISQQAVFNSGQLINLSVANGTYILSLSNTETGKKYSTRIMINK